MPMTQRPRFSMPRRPRRYSMLHTRCAGCSATACGLPSCSVAQRVRSMKLCTAVRSMLWCSDECLVLKNTSLGLRVARPQE